MNILHMTGILKALDPTSVRSIVKDEDIVLAPGKPKEFRFDPGYLLYIIIRIDDSKTGLGKYVNFYAQRFWKEQALAKPEVAGMPIEMKKWRAWRERGSNPGLLEYDEDEGVYVIEANFQEGQAQIEDPYKIAIYYPRKEILMSYGDSTALANWGKPVMVEVKIAVKEIDYEKAAHLLENLYANAFRKAFRDILYPPEILKSMV